MNKAKSILFFVHVVIFSIPLAIDNAWAGRSLSKEIAPYVAMETRVLLDQYSELYFQGQGQTDVLLIADVFCENSRKTYSLLKTKMKEIRDVKVLLVSRYPRIGSDLVAAYVLRMLAIGKGASALDSAFNFGIPMEAGFKGRRQAMDTSMKAFQIIPGANETPDSLAELKVVSRNTEMAIKIGYTGTPHLVVGDRVLHGYSKAAIKIMLKENP